MGKRKLASRILSVLRSSPLPVSTPDIVLLCAFGKPRSRVWKALNSLRRNGLVSASRITAKRLVGNRGECPCCKKIHVLWSRGICATCNKVPELVATREKRYSPHTVIVWTAEP